MKAALALIVAAATSMAARPGAASARDEPEPTAPAAPRSRAGATLYGYSVPDEADFLMLVALAELGRLHLEGRYDYEGLRTGSVFMGVSGRGERRVQVDWTAMLGAAIGDVHGVIPAGRLTLSWWRLDLFAEAEYVVVTGELATSFFYCWSELGVSPVDWLRLAIVGQRTHVIHNALEVQRGLAAGVALGDTLTLTAYELNLGWISPTYIAAVGLRL